MMEIVEKAIKYATEAHGDQKRKYTGEPYITHPIAVMEIVKTVAHTKEMLAAAVLHDVIEDTNLNRRNRIHIHHSFIILYHFHRFGMKPLRTFSQNA